MGLLEKLKLQNLHKVRCI